MARTSKRICPAREGSPRRKPPDTAHERKDLPRAGTRPTAKARRTSKRICPRENALLGEGLPTQRTSERICPTQERSPRQRPPDTARERKDLPARERSPRRRPLDTAHERKNLPRAETLPTAKASRHGAKAKEFAPRENTPHGEGLPTRRKGKRICPAREHAPWRRPPDTAHERKDLPRAGTRPAAKASRHGARAKGFAPAQGSRSPHVPTNGGPPPSDGQPEKHPFGGVAPERARPLPSSFTEKKKTTP